MSRQCINCEREAVEGGPRCQACTINHDIDQKRKTRQKAEKKEAARSDREARGVSARRDALEKAVGAIGLIVVLAGFGILAVFGFNALFNQPEEQLTRYSDEACANLKITVLMDESASESEQAAAGQKYIDHCE